MSVDHTQFMSLDVEYARFNSLKTVRDPRPSRFGVHHVGPLVVTCDPARPGSYYNRVLGLAAGSLSRLDDALGYLPSGCSWRVDLEDGNGTRPVATHLESRGWRCVNQLAWLRATTRVAQPRVEIHRLDQIHHPEVLEMLELEGPIDTALWDARREHLCSDKFRFFAVREGGRVVSMATTFVGIHGAVLGSAVTRKECRGRGYHQALLEGRLGDAAKLGLRSVWADVEPGSTSHRNCERVGFVIFRTLQLWEPMQAA